MKRSNLMRFLALTAAAALLSTAMAGCRREDEGIDPEYVEQLESECVDLRNQNQDLEDQLGDLEQTIILKSYTLKAIPNEAGDGATVEMTASPMRHDEKQTASFRVSLNEEEIALIPAQWKETAYIGSAELSAADGYTYECILTQEDGSESTITLSSPDTPLYESCVYLAASLSAYCNLFVEDWAQADGKLILTTGYAQVQMPRIGSHNAEYQTSELVLRLGDRELQRLAVEMPEGEGEGSYETVLENVEFTMPEIEDEQQLDLWLEVTLSDGTTLTYNGCSWFFTGGELTLAVG